jgi:D-alanyl-D-alanine carboxypeptidase (penicillin-binding protein 5/6)
MTVGRAAACALSFYGLLAVHGAMAAQSQSRAAIGVRSAEPYLGAIAVDARSGQTVFEDRADEPGYPASVVKLMDLLLILDSVQQGAVHLTNQVQVTAEAAGIGGSQVYLKEREVFTVEDLIFALVIQSANDAAVALAMHLAGTCPAFVGRMNRRARELGMTRTQFHSVHGLPPAAGQEPDVSTARDLAVLARELVTKHPEALRYTSTAERGFRNNTFIMRTHNRLLAEVAGCDGLKTGYIRAGGYSIVATAQRSGRRAIVVVLGSRQRETREAKAKDLLATGLAAPVAVPPPPPPPTNAPSSPALATQPAKQAAAEKPGSKKRRLLAVAGGGALVLFLVTGVVARLRFRRYDTFR